MSERLEQISADYDKAVGKVNEAREKNWEGLTPEECNDLIADARKIKNAYDLEIEAKAATEPLPNIETESEKIAKEVVKESLTSQAEKSVDELTYDVKAQRAALGDWLRNPGAITNLSDYDVHVKETNPELYATLSRGVNDEGGYGVRMDIQREVIQRMVTTGSIRSLATVMTVSDGAPKRWVTSDNNDLKATFQGAENYNATDRSDIELDRVEFDFDRLDTDVIPLSWDLRTDASFDVVGFITGTIARLFQVGMEEAFVKGSSVSGVHIQGIEERVPSAQTLTSSTTGVSTINATTLTIDNMVDALYALDEFYGDDAVFLINKSTLPVLLKAKDNDGRFLLQPNAQLGNPGVVHGKEVFLHRYMDGIGTGNTPLICGRMRDYVIMDIANELEVAVYTDSNYARKRQVGYHGSTRLSANVIQPRAFSKIVQP